MNRRGFVLGCGCCGALAALAGLAAGADEWRMPPRLVRPAAGTEEGGLWGLLDREEQKLRRSRFVVRDPALQKYLTDIACRVGGEHCADLRVYLVRTPFFNASMAPNGMMQVWTGLLLRMANEAQLAAIIGHEIGHYLGRHAVEQLRDAKSRSAFGQFMGMAFGAAGLGGVGSIAQLAVLAGAFSFSREQEREADRIGLALLADAGYPAIEASRVWEQLLRELEAEKDWSGDPGSRSVLFATHPAPDERRRDLAERAAALERADADARAAEYLASIRGHRREWLEDELRRHRSGETLALMQRLTEASPDDAELRYFLGEAYRLRASEGDAERALAAYREAEARPGCPPEVFRAMGILQQRAGDTDAARTALRRYLELKPDADDAEMIRSYLEAN